MVHTVALATFFASAEQRPPAFLALHEPPLRGFCIVREDLYIKGLEVDGPPLVLLRPHALGFKRRGSVRASHHSHENFMKKFINRPENVVEEMLQGFAVLSAAVGCWSGHKVTRERQVAIISGNGSAYEPAHAGQSGAGMLSATIAEGRQQFVDVLRFHTLRGYVLPRIDWWSSNTQPQQGSLQQALDPYTSVIG